MAHDIPHPIAIIGSACRLPGNASSPSKLWELLKNPRDLLRKIPRDRFHWEGAYRPGGRHGSIGTKEGYFLEENIRQFDPQFFNIPPAEAENLDPQHRLLLENVYEAIESAGLLLENLQGTDTGVFVGLMNDEYYQNANHDVDASCGQILTTGSVRSMAANRISYTFDFRGPSMSIDTACSSSMMAVHLAVSSLRQGESKIAFACGSHLNLTPNVFKGLTKMNMISAEGRSKMFDETADGYGRGEGTAVVCMKRLDIALADNDPIECIIRETGTNQDGRTKGITMPSAYAQADLIRKTYLSAGLDPTCAGSRPSFFEAHGTGTLVGDPLEAEAIEAAFFPRNQEYDEDEILYLGSIKTIIGHTEGAAGIAGLLRAALAVRHGVIPPNLLFTRMNPSVVPYSTHLRLVATATPWPSLPKGCPRRASINSFGFGGSNVHVIIESWDTSLLKCVPTSSSFIAADIPVYTPFTFSANSERALTSRLEDLQQYLQDDAKGIDIRDLAWTLQYKRSQFTFRHTIGAKTKEELIRNIEYIIKKSYSKQHTGVFTQAHQSSRPRVMGIFTGQGAQWATMGRDLIKHSAHARKIIESLDATLSALPLHRPQWKLREEMVVDEKKSRINEATLSQPLTTAMQILLVDLLSEAGISFHSIVGHSSGEIVAAYAAGMLSAEDAIRIAYYRGLYSKFAVGEDGQPGAMLATSLSLEEAANFCDRSEFRNRIVPAASNSPSITTISGDADAISQANTMLDQKGVRARKLYVDKAYHSHHMTPCAGPYLSSLEQSEILPMDSQEGFPIWFSSTYPGNRIILAKQISAQYWIDNLTSQVHFYEAVTTALSELGVPELIIEVGPHPVLEQPVREIIANIAHNGVVYTGLVKRGSSAIVSFSDALGLIWSRFGRHIVNLAGYDRALSSITLPLMIKDLPSYPWQYGKEYWWENRLLRRRYQAKTPPNELLGEEWQLGASHESKWRQFLDPKGVPWLLQHKLNGLSVLPGAAYVLMVAVAAQRKFRSHDIEMIEIKDLGWELPIAFADEHTAIETILTFANITEDRKGQHHANADFFIDFCSHQKNEELMTAARGRLAVHFDSDTDSTYSEPFPQPSYLKNLKPETFYRNLLEAGYGYTGPFRSIVSLKRRIDFATGELAITPHEMLFHPAILDGLFQACFAAEGVPGDSAIPEFRVPSRVRSIKIFPTQLHRRLSGKSHKHISQTATSEDSLPHPLNEAQCSLRFDVMRTRSSEYSGIICDDHGTLIQMDGFSTAPFHMSTPEDDLDMYCEVVWKPYYPSVSLDVDPFVASVDKSKRTSIACERVALYYLRKLNEVIAFEDEQHVEQPVRHLLEYARLLLVEVYLGLQPRIDETWLRDDQEAIESLIKQYPDVIDLQYLVAMGKAYPSIILQRKIALDTFLQAGSLEEFYRSKIGLPEVNGLLASFISTLSHRSPKIRILEVGAGTGAATERVLESAEYFSFVFTDVSPGFLGPAKEKFKNHGERISFRVFDMEKDILQQGFEPASFDVIIASNVLHASADVKSVLHRLRSLLHPGGYLTCIELAATNQNQNTLLFGGLDGWWLGHGKDRSWSPALTEHEWDKYLKDTGFGGINAITPPFDELLCPYRVFCAQAIDERILSLHDPLLLCFPKNSERLLILGENLPGKPTFIDDLKSLLSPSFHQVDTIPRLEDISEKTQIPRAVLSVIELREPVFRSISPSRWTSLQRLFSEAADVLWVTTGVKTPKDAEAAYANMMIGLGRVIRHELPHLRLTFLDIDNLDLSTVECVSQAILRWYILGQWAAKGWPEDIMFSHEIELAIEDGVTLVPRFKTSKLLNDRYNSRHRRILREMEPHASPVRLSFDFNTYQYALEEIPRLPTQSTSDDLVLIKILFSTLYAIKVKSVGFVFVGLGVCRNGNFAIVLSDTICSFVQVPRSAVYLSHPTRKPSVQYLQAIAANFIAECVVGSARSELGILVLCSDSIWISSIQEKVEKHGKTVTFITSQPDFQPERTILIHQNYLDTTIRNKIPPNTSVFINLSNNQEDQALFKRVCSILRNDAFKFKDTHMTLKETSLGYDYSRTSALQLKLTAGRYVKEAAALPAACYDSSATTNISPRDVVEQSMHSSSTIVDWTLAKHIPVAIRPATTTITFDPSKTYLVIGSSDVAQSISEWMVCKGAKYIIIGSRNPSNLASWVQNMTSNGAFVDVHVLDITDETSVSNMVSRAREGLNTSCTKFPPFGGVIHLGLILKDSAFPIMSFEDFIAVTEVKAKGSLILHEQLLKENLDFFILTSSISYSLGNPGQANYACGNAFMVGLVNYRRGIGLPASVIDLGTLTGIGYISRNTNKRLGGSYDGKKDIHKQALYPISERDLHEIVAEAILASPADSGRNPEIITGIRKIEPGAAEYYPWTKDTMFAHLLSEHTTCATPRTQHTLSIREHLREIFSSTTPDSVEDHVTSIVYAALINRLSFLLQLDDINGDVSPIELGIDSLVASEIGRWAKKELGVQIPISLIFGGASVDEIVRRAVRQLDKGWVMTKD